eukprot:1611974-Alexandrium_andersonii.AAC.1
MGAQLRVSPIGTQGVRSKLLEVRPAIDDTTNAQEPSAQQFSLNCIHAFAPKCQDKLGGSDGRARTDEGVCNRRL